MEISKSAAKKMIQAYSDLVPTSTPNLAGSQHVSENAPRTIQTAPDAVSAVRG